ncbi:hypothetical protein TNCV_762861 [Trichonephila clavipes]|nr:hypothetical protein TNCV_762861 [Trichonephila clavipes]
MSKPVRAALAARRAAVAAIQNYSDNWHLKNEAVDEPAGKGYDLPVLSHSEIHSLNRAKMNLTWRNPPAHHWYAAKSPGRSLQYRNYMALQTALTRFRSSPLRGLQGYFPGTAVWRSRPSVTHYYAESQAHWNRTRGRPTLRCLESDFAIDQWSSRKTLEKAKAYPGL